MSSATALPLVTQIETTEPDMNPTIPAATPQTRKRSVTFGTVPQRSPRMARLDLPAPSADESSGSTIHYGVYNHDLLKKSDNTVPKLITKCTDFTSAYEAMRKHAAGQIEANVHWGATKELATNNLYEILGHNNRILLRYELDAVSPAGQDANGVQTWERTSTSPAPPVHYGMYVDLHCDIKGRAEQFFIGGFKSLGEANHAMKQSAAMYIHGHGGAKLYERGIEVMNEKGQLQWRFTIKKGRRSKNGSFVREEDWYLEQDRIDSKVPVIRLPTPETWESPEPHLSPVVPEVARQAAPQVPALVVPKQQAVRGTRRQTSVPPANKTQEEQPKVKFQAKPTAPAKANTAGKSKAQQKTKAQTRRDPNPYCKCRLPDDGSLMIGCDNEKCPIGWYHGRCIGILQAMPEEEEWYCEMCTREQVNKKPRRMTTLAGKTAVKTSVKKGGRGDAKGKVKAKATAKAKKGKSS